MITKLLSLAAPLSLLASLAAAQDSLPQGVRAAYDAGRHAVHEYSGGFEASNPGQGWRIGFDTRGFLVEPAQSDWRWGLELVSYGFEGSELLVGESACASAEGGRVAYSWDDGIEEWYVNDTRGFEHGFTLHDRPRGGAGDGQLRLELRVRGDLIPSVHASRRGVAFVAEDGQAVLNYSGLTVFDANGKTLEAWFECGAGTISFVVDESEAQYPLTIDPVAQEAYFKASNTEGNDWFGFSVSISEDTIVIGAPFERSNATGVDGDQNSNAALASGAAYVFRLINAVWKQEAYLKASNTDPNDEFGRIVSISGDTIVIGSTNESSNAAGVNGDESSNSASRTGAAYVYNRIGTTWSQQAYLKASNPDDNDNFGAAATVSGDTIVIGAPQESSNSLGVNGSQGNNSSSTSGAAYVFTRTGTTWTQQAYLKASNTGSFDRFGIAVSLSDDTLVVGAAFERSNATGVNGNQTDNSAFLAGAAYVFVRNGSTWSQEAYLKASNTDIEDAFGAAVSVSQDTIVIGALQEDSNATGVNGDQTNETNFSSGAAYVFGRTGTSWTQEAYLKSSNSGNFDGFGTSVDVHGDTLVVGAASEASGSAGVNGNQNDNSASGSGAAYAFRRSATSWTQVAYLKSSAPDFGDSFGFSVSLSEDTIVSGSHQEDSKSIGVNGNANDNTAFESGAAFAFLITPPVLPEFCNGNGGDQAGCTNCPCMNNASPGNVGGCVNSAGTSARLIASGDLSVSLAGMATSDLRFAISGAPAGAMCILNSGDGLAPDGIANPCFGLSSGVQAVAFDGLRCAILNTRRHGNRLADSNGNVGVTNSPWGGEGEPTAGIAIANGYVSGQTRYFQVINRDDPLASCMRGLNTSQALEITFEP